MLKLIIIQMCLLLATPAAFAQTQTEASVREKIEAALNRISNYVEALPTQPWHDDDLFSSSALMTAGGLGLTTGGAVGFYFTPSPENHVVNEVLRVVRRGSYVTMQIGKIVATTGFVALVAESVLGVIDAYRGFETTPRLKRMSGRLMNSPDGTRLLVKLSQTNAGRDQLTQLALADTKFCQFLTAFAQL